MLKPERDTIQISRILSNIGSVYEDLADYRAAGQYFHQSLLLNDSVNYPHERVIQLNNLGDVAYKQGHFIEAIQWTERALALAQSLQDNYEIRSALRDLGQLHAAQGKHQQAYAYLDSAVTYYKKIYSEDGLKQIARLEAFFESEKKEKEIRLLEKDRRISQLIISLFIACLISFIIIGVMLYLRQQGYLRQKQELFAAQEKLMKAQLEDKSRSLTSYSLHLMEKNQLLQQLQNEIKSLSRHETKNPKRQLKTLSRNIDVNLSHEKDWNSFRLAFEAVHPSFFKELSQQNSQLTHADLKLAALMKMNLDSREIATILNISSDSLRVAQYRLRKKLDLEKGIKLSSFLHTI